MVTGPDSHLSHTLVASRGLADYSVPPQKILSECLLILALGCGCDLAGWQVLVEEAGTLLEWVV